MRSKIKISIILNILIVVFEILSLFIAFKNNGISMFMYYTELSNILALLSSSIYLIYIFTNKKINLFISSFKFLSTLCLLITFLVVIFILIPLTGLNSFAEYFKHAMFFHHLICPLLSYITFIYFDDIVINKKYPKLVVSWTLLYGIILTVLNILKKVDGPYPFLRVYEQPIYMSFIWSILIIGFSYVLSTMLMRKILNKNYQ